MSNENEFIVKGKNFEIKQVEPARSYVNIYVSFITKLANNKNVMNMALLEEQKKEADEETIKEIDEKISSLSSSLGDESENMNNAFNALVLGSIKGSFLEAGYFRKDGIEVDVDEKLILSLPPALYEVLKDNAQKLIEITEAIEKN